MLSRKTTFANGRRVILRVAAARAIDIAPRQG
jgi:hypothetical protein